MARSRRNKREIWSFFTGAMGFDLGLEQAGLRSTLAVELDDSCCKTLHANRPNLHTWQADISEIDGDAVRRHRDFADDVFLMVGGPPCQSFSTAGKRAALSDPRGNLIYNYLRLIEQIRPRYFLLENVAHLVTAPLRHRPISDRPGKKWNLSKYSASPTIYDDDEQPMQPDELSGSAVRQIVSDAVRLGYGINFGIFNAADYGAPQHRMRFVMFGSREKAVLRMPAPEHGDGLDERRPWKTVGDAIGDLRKNPGPHSQYTPAVARFFMLIPPGGNWRSLPPNLQREALGEASFAAGGGKTGFFRRLSWDTPAPTITGRANRKGSAMCHPQFTRPLSVRECARLQGFPDDWSFDGSMSDQYMQVGNAVPVHLGAAAGRAVMGALRKTAVDRSEADMERMLAGALNVLRATARNKRTAKRAHDPDCQFDLFAGRGKCSG